MTDFAISAILTVYILANIMNLGGLLLWVERKGSAVLQDRIGANRAALMGKLPINIGIINTLVADPIKLFTKEDFVPPSADKLLHALAPAIAMVPALIAFIAIPFGDVLVVAGRTINLQAANLNVGLLYILGMVSLGVYGVVLAGWASNNRWALMGGIRASAQMISYEIAMGLALIGIIMISHRILALLNLQKTQRIKVMPLTAHLHQPV